MSSGRGPHLGRIVLRGGWIEMEGLETLVSGEGQGYGFCRWLPHLASSAGGCCHRMRKSFEVPRQSRASLRVASTHYRHARPTPDVVESWIWLSQRSFRLLCVRLVDFGTCSPCPFAAGAFSSHSRRAFPLPPRAHPASEIAPGSSVAGNPIAAPASAAAAPGRIGQC
jgi:hypothetical protein